ncbi:hypothetical protein AAMO2058_000559400 [Amorphochlora amoebiformis]
MPQRHVRQRIDQAISMLQNCSKRINMLRIAQSQIEAKHYVQALSTLERLSHVPHYESRIAQLIETVIKQFKAKIKACVRAEYDEWLEKVPEMSREVGKVLLFNTREELSRAKNSSDANANGDGEGDDDAKESGLLLSGGLDKEQVHVLIMVKDSLGTVYQSLHINQLLAAEDFAGLKKYSEIKRGKQARKLIEDITSATQVDLFRQREEYFGAILGFFAIQLEIIRSPLGGLLQSVEECHKLWVKICGSLERSLTSLFESLQSPVHWKELRGFTTCFIHAIKANKLPTTPLKSLMGSKKSAYKRLLEKQIDRAVDKLLDRDHFEPITIPDQQTYERLVAEFSLDDSDMSSRLTRFPAMMPFSISVPMICKAMVNLMENYTSFKLAEAEPRGDGNVKIGSEDRKASKGEVDDPYAELVSVVDSSLQMSVCVRISPEAIAFRGSDRKSGKGGQRAELPQSMVAQLLVNCGVLAKACDHFEERAFRLVEESYPRRATPNHKATLVAKGKLEGLKMQFNAMLLEGLGGRINKLLELSTFNWKATKRSTVPWEACEDLVALLTGSFASLSFLPAGLREGAHLHAFNHISQEIRRFWRYELRGFTVVGLADFDISLRVIEDFARRCTTVPGVVEALEDIRQITNLILKEEEILQVGDRKYLQRNYRRVQPDLLCDLLSKFQTLGMFVRVPPGLPKHNRRDVEAVVKSLRDSGRIS